MARYSIVIALLVVVSGCRDETASRERRALLLKLADPRPASRIDAIGRLAEKADRGETTAIAKAAKDAPAEVRVAVAAGLGRSPAPEAIDLLGAMLRDPSDAVRAAAVEGLAKKRPDRKALSYLVRAWAGGGPKTRVAVVSAGELAAAVKAEREKRRASLDERLVDPRTQIRAEALEELGLEGSEAAIAELSARLVDGDPVLAAAAARGLANAGASTQIPLLAKALSSGRPAVVQAAATALGELGAGPAEEALAAALDGADLETARVLIRALGGAVRSDTARGHVCARALVEADATLALEAAGLVGEGCAPGELDADPQKAARQLLVLATSRRAGAGAIARARDLLKSEDAFVAAAAATLLGVAGAASDVPALAAIARREFDANELARAKRAAALADERQEARRDVLEEHDELEVALRLGGDARKLPKPLKDKLSKLIVSKTPASEAGPWEHRPGAVELIGATATAAARLGGADPALAADLAADHDPRLRRVALGLAGDAKGVPEWRAALSNDEEPTVRAAAILDDLRSGRASDAAVANVLAAATAEDRVALLEVLRPRAAGFREAIVAATREGDAAVAAAVVALSQLDDPALEAVFGERLDDPRQLGAYSAVKALARRRGAGVDELLARAAAHPNGAVQVAALEALAAHGTCEAAGVFAPLAEAFEGRVRSAAAALVKACPAAAP